MDSKHSSLKKRDTPRNIYIHTRDNNPGRIIANILVIGTTSRMPHTVKIHERKLVILLSTKPTFFSDILNIMDKSQF